MILYLSICLMSFSSCFISISRRSLWDFFDMVSVTNERPWYSRCSWSQFFFRPCIVDQHRDTHHLIMQLSGFNSKQHTLWKVFNISHFAVHSPSLFLHLQMVSHGQQADHFILTWIGQKYFLKNWQIRSSCSSTWFRCLHDPLLLLKKGNCHCAAMCSSTSRMACRSSSERRFMAACSLCSFTKVSYSSWARCFSSTRCCRYSGTSP